MYYSLISPYSCTCYMYFLTLLSLKYKPSRVFWEDWIDIDIFTPVRHVKGKQQRFWRLQPSVLFSVHFSCLRVSEASCRPLSWISLCPSRCWRGAWGSLAPGHALIAHFTSQSLQSWTGPSLSAIITTGALSTLLLSLLFPSIQTQRLYLWIILFLAVQIGYHSMSQKNVMYNEVRTFGQVLSDTEEVIGRLISVRSVKLLWIFIKIVNFHKWFSFVRFCKNDEYNLSIWLAAVQLVTCPHLSPEAGCSWWRRLQLRQRSHSAERGSALGCRGPSPTAASAGWPGTPCWTPWSR